MKKKYEKPVMNITVFAVNESTNAITLSSDYGRTVTSSMGKYSRLNF